MYQVSSLRDVAVALPGLPRRYRRLLPSRAPWGRPSGPSAVRQGLGLHSLRQSVPRHSITASPSVLVQRRGATCVCDSRGALLGVADGHDNGPVRLKRFVAQQLAARFSLSLPAPPSRKSRRPSRLGTESARATRKLELLLQDAARRRQQRPHPTGVTATLLVALGDMYSWQLRAVRRHGESLPLTATVGREGATDLAAAVDPCFPPESDFADETVRTLSVAREAEQDRLTRASAFPCHCTLHHGF